MTDTTVLLAGSLRAEMARRRISGVGMARRLGRPQGWVSRRLTGDVPITVDDLYEFSRVLELDPWVLLPRMDSNHQPAGYGTVVPLRPRLALAPRPRLALAPTA